jgi:hypothetical protein
MSCEHFPELELETMATGGHSTNIFSLLQQQAEKARISATKNELDLDDKVLYMVFSSSFGKNEIYEKKVKFIFPYHISSPGKKTSRRQSNNRVSEKVYFPTTGSKHNHTCRALKITACQSGA